MSYEYDNPWALFEEAYTRARMLAASGKSMGTYHEAKRAHSIAFLQKWRYRRLKIEEEFSIGSTEVISVHSRSSMFLENSMTTTNAAHLQRKLDALLSLSLASPSVLNQDEQAKIVLKESMRILGAERAFLFIAEEDKKELVFQRGLTVNNEDLNGPGMYSRTIIERVYDTGKALVLSTKSDAQELDSESVIAYDLRSVLAAPLLLSDNVLGVIYLDNSLARGIFNQEDIEIIMALGNHIAVALQTTKTAQLEVQLHVETKRRRLAETLRELNANLTSTLNLSESLERLIYALKKELNFECSLVVMRNEKVFETALSHGFEGRKLPSFLENETFSLNFENCKEAKVLSAEELGGDSLETYLVIPLLSRDSIAGFIFLVRTTFPTFSTNDIELGMTLVGQASIAIENASLFLRVKSLAEMDELTGLYNRREFFRRSELAFAKAHQQNLPLAAIMFDIDHFKIFNDRYGHAIGDDVLRIVGKITSDAIRDVDILGRYGGEEFAVLLPGATKKIAGEVGERLRKVVDTTLLPTKEFGNLSIAISVGAAVCLDDHDLNFLLSRSDQALYESKDNGRNMVTVV